MIENFLKKIVIIVPILNEEKSLAELFFALERQTLPPNKIIFIDAGSNDSSVKMIADWASFCSTNNKIKVIHLLNTGGSPGENRNLGIVKADSEWIAFLDAGISPVPDWLSSLASEIEGTGQKAIFGRCFFNSASAFGRSVCAQSYGCTDMPVMPASLYHASVFDEVGMFQEGIRAAEDRLWMLKFDRIYGQRLSSKKILALYNHFPTTLGSVIKKWWTYQNSTINSKVPDKKTWFLPFLFFIILSGFYFSNAIGLCLVWSYFFLRGFCEPVRRSKKIFWWEGVPMALVWAPIVGICIDLTLIGASIRHLYIRIKNALF